MYPATVPETKIVKMVVLNSGARLLTEPLFVVAPAESIPAPASAHRCASICGMRPRILALLFLAAICLPACFAQSALSSAHSSNVYPMQEGFVDSHGVLIYYKMMGRGAPLMIVHGGPGASHDYFLPYLLPLMRSNKLVFIDERGGGKSSKLADAKDYNI